MAADQSRLSGRDGEDKACAHLRAQGLLLLERNYRCRMGELDLVMRDGEQLVFVEVRSRANSRYGHPAETVTRSKQRRLARAAQHYLQTRARSGREPPPCRFDVVAISDAGRRIDWIRDAFQPKD